MRTRPGVLGLAPCSNRSGSGGDAKRRASICPPSRPQQLLTYWWDRALGLCSRPRRYCGFVLLLLLGVPALGAREPFSAEQYLADIKYLASDQLKGRGNGQPELDQAAGYIEKSFRRAGLRSFRSLKGYRQFFQITAETVVGKDSRLRLAGRDYELDRDYSVLSFSNQAAGEGEAVFCGYGIVSPDAGYDDYAGKEIRGKVALVLDGYPARLGARRPSIAPLAAVTSKIALARHLGAIALIVVREPRESPSRAADQMGIPAFAVSPALIPAIFGVDSNYSISPEAVLAPVRMNWDLKVHQRKKRIANVVAYAAPRGAIAEWIVVGAHYDHLGLGEKFALDPNAVGQPHNGADDNASGTAGVLSLARVLGRDTAKLRRGIIFVAFAGEELGLLGSAHFVKNLPPEAGHIAAMVNLDMIGRPRGKIYLSGVGSALEFEQMVRDLPTPVQIEKPLAVETSQSSLAGSDHVSFTQHGIPALFFFSGLHSDYHKASDDWDKIDSYSTIQVLEMVRQLVENLATSTAELHFVRVPETRITDRSSGSGYGAYFGSVPDFSQEEGGVRFADVQQGGPAYKAGLRAGDLLVRFDGEPISNLYEFTYALRSHAAGQAVDVECVRDGQTIKTTVTLEERP